MVEHDSVWDPATVAAPGMGWAELGVVGRLDQGSELDPQRLDQDAANRGTDLPGDR
jgi:hypothetical protein